MKEAENYTLSHAVDLLPLPQMFAVFSKNVAIWGDHVYSCGLGTVRRKVLDRHRRSRQFPRTGPVRTDYGPDRSSLTVDITNYINFVRKKQSILYIPNAHHGRDMSLDVHDAVMGVGGTTLHKLGVPHESRY